MSKRGRKDTCGMKWASRRVAPMLNTDGEIINAMDAKYDRKGELTTLEEFIEAEKPAQMRVFQVMGCDTALSNQAWAAIKLAYESAGKKKE